MPVYPQWIAYEPQSLCDTFVAAIPGAAAIVAYDARSDPVNNDRFPPLSLATTGEP